MKARPDPLAVLDSIAPEHVPAAIIRLAARAMVPPTADCPAEEPLLSVEAVMRLLGRPRRWVTRHAPELGGMKLGAKLFFTRSRINRNLERRKG